MEEKDPAYNLTSKFGSPEKRLWEKDKPYFNGNISLLVNYLNNITALKDLVINETGYTRNRDLETEDGFSDLQSIQQNLLKNGLVLKQEERLVKVFVV